MQKRFHYLKRLGLYAGLIAALLLTAACSTNDQGYLPGAYPTPMATVRGPGLPDVAETPTADFTPPADVISDELREIAYYVDSQQDSTVFARCYVSHDPPMLHVNVVEGKLEEANLPDIDGLIIHEVKYSSAELEKVRDMIWRHYMGKGVNALSVDAYTNKVRVGLEEESASLEKDILDDVPSEDMVRFEIFGTVIPF